MNTGFTEGGSPDLYSYENDVRWFPSQSAYIAGTAAIYAEEDFPGSQILMGTYMDEALALCEIARRKGAFMIGGTDYSPYIPYFVALCNYSLIGEEMFIASAYLTDDVSAKASVVAEDLLKWILMGVTFLAAIAYAAGFHGFLTWMQL
jgi:hypothetical protein